MKKTILKAFILLGLFQVKAQINPDSLFTDEWINPSNNVPYITEIAIFNPMDSFPLGDTVPWIFNGDFIYSYDTFPVLNYFSNPISQTNYKDVFGPTAQASALDSITLFEQLLNLSPVNSSIIINQSEWFPGVWDTIILPWVTDREILSTPRSMGVEVAWKWELYAPDVLESILSPTVPVIQGEDFDFISIPENFALDNLDSLDLATKVQIALNDNIYIYSLDEFQEVYDAFILSLFDEPLFYPGQFNFNTFHLWLKNYLIGESASRIQQLNMEEYSPSSLHLIKEDVNNYYVDYLHPIYQYEIFDAHGRLIESSSFNENQRILIPDQSHELLFIRFRTEKGYIVKKIIP